MPGALRLKAARRVQNPPWEYLGGETFTNPNNQAMNLPSTASIVRLEAEDGEAFYVINDAIVGPTSPGYVPSGDGRTVGPISNLTSMRVHSPTGIVHIIYYREV